MSQVEACLGSRVLSIRIWYQNYGPFLGTLNIRHIGFYRGSMEKWKLLYYIRVCIGVIVPLKEVLMT